MNNFSSTRLDIDHNEIYVFKTDVDVNSVFT